MCLVFTLPDNGIWLLPVEAAVRLVGNEVTRHVGAARAISARRRKEKNRHNRQIAARFCYRRDLRRLWSVPFVEQSSILGEEELGTETILGFHACRVCGRPAVLLPRFFSVRGQQYWRQKDCENE